MLNHNKKLLILSFMTFVFSLSLSVLIYANKTTQAVFEGDCFYCNPFSGTCVIQTGGTGWTICEDASPGSPYCGFGGSDCEVEGPGEG